MCDNINNVIIGTSIENDNDCAKNRMFINKI